MLQSGELVYGVHVCNPALAGCHNKHSDRVFRCGTAARDQFRCVHSWLTANPPRTQLRVKMNISLFESHTCSALCHHFSTAARALGESQITVVTAQAQSKRPSGRSSYHQSVIEGAPRQKPRLSTPRRLAQRPPKRFPVLCNDRHDGACCCGGLHQPCTPTPSNEYIN